MSRPNLGVRAQQTLNCDYINISRGASVHNINVETINNKSIQQLIRDAEEIKKIKDDLEQLKKDVESIRRNAGPIGFQAGRAVEVTVFFEDVDLSNVNIPSFQETLIQAFAEASGRSEHDIVIINVEDNEHSTISTVEVRFTGAEGEKESQDFVIKLNSGIVESFRKLHHYSPNAHFVYELSFEVTPIRSTNAKVDMTKKVLSAPELNFQKSQALVLDTFKLKSDGGGALFIQKYDENIGEYVGGTIVTD